jgi:hypothetical protein
MGKKGIMSENEIAKIIVDVPETDEF